MDNDEFEEVFINKKRGRAPTRPLETNAFSTRDSP